MNIDSTSCSACGEPCLDKTFACLKCKYYFHESCLELPREIQHSFHSCPLSLRQATTIFRCRACKENRTQFALMFTGIFDGQNYILNYYHQHPLILCNKEKERNDHVVSCDGCNQVIYGEIYGCLHCDFYLRHKHFSIILDDKENEVCCGVCDQKRNICSPSYDCNRCNFFIHQDCLEPTEEEVQHPFHNRCSSGLKKNSS